MEIWGQGGVRRTGEEMVIARAQPQRWMVLAGWLLAGGRVGWRAGWLWRMRRPRESRRSQVAGRKSQVASRKSQVAGSGYGVEGGSEGSDVVHKASPRHPPPQKQASNNLRAWRMNRVGGRPLTKVGGGEGGDLEVQGGVGLERASTDMRVCY